MGVEKVELARDFFNQVESQVQFGDNKASLLVAGDAILLAVSGGFIKMVSGCEAAEFPVGCVVPSIELALATSAALLLIISLACALWAARPAIKHGDPPREFFLLSHVGAKKEPQEFLEWYRSISDEDLLSEALVTIHGKARYATGKFRWLKHAVHATLASLLVLLLALVTAVVPKAVG
jgi:hypothetical protein